MKLIELLCNKWGGEWRVPNGYDFVVQDGDAPFAIYAFNTTVIEHIWGINSRLIDECGLPVVVVLPDNELSNDYETSAISDHAFREFISFGDSNYSQKISSPNLRQSVTLIAKKLREMGYSLETFGLHTS